MKNIRIYILSTLTLCLISCGKDNTDKDPCENGYDKDDKGACTISWASNFVGTELEAEDTTEPGSVNTGTYVYNTTLKALNATTIESFNLSGYGITNKVEIVATSANTVVIDYTDGAGRKFEGSGTLANKVLNINITITFTDNTQDVGVIKITYP